MNENDLILVRNILTDDEGTDIILGYSYKDYFQVTWNGEEIRIPAGQTKILPRYQADHFCEHLINYILGKNKQMIQHPTLRQNLRNKIILGDATKEELQKIRNSQTQNIDNSSEKITPEIKKKETELLEKENEISLKSQEVEKQSKKLSSLMDEYEKKIGDVNNQAKIDKVKEVKKELN